MPGIYNKAYFTKVIAPLQNAALEANFIFLAEGLPGQDERKSRVATYEYLSIYKFAGLQVI